MEWCVGVHVAALLAQIPYLRFEARAGLRSGDLHGGSKSISRMSAAIGAGSRCGVRGGGHCNRNGRDLARAVIFRRSSASASYVLGYVAVAFAGNLTSSTAAGNIAANIAVNIANFCRAGRVFDF